MSTGKTLTAVIPTYNCGSVLSECLESVKWVDEIIIVDMGSTDNTLKIARKYGATVYFKIPKEGNFDLNRKFGMQKASSDWILKLDSDEVLSKTLQEEIQEFLRTDNGYYNGIFLYNRIFMLGKQIHHGFIRDNSNEMRLVRKGRWLYNPYRFHQTINVRGNTGYLDHYYDHHNIRTVREFIGKMNLYTEIDASHYDPKVTMLKIVLAPIKSFFKLFVLQKGFLDGQTGFTVCMLYSLYNLSEKIKAWEYQKTKTNYIG